MSETQDLIESKRIRAIFNSRENVQEIKHYLKQQDLTGLDGRSTYRRALETYVQELYPVCQKAERGNEYWNAVDFGTVVVGPDSLKGKVRNPTSKYYQLQGFGSLIEHPDPYTAEFRVKKTIGFGRRVEETEVVKEQPTFSQLNTIFLTTDKFLEEVGLGLELQEDKDPASI